MPLRAFPALVMNFITSLRKKVLLQGDFFFKVIIFKTQALLSGYLVAKKNPFAPAKEFLLKLSPSNYI